MIKWGQKFPGERRCNCIIGTGSQPLLQQRSKIDSRTGFGKNQRIVNRKIIVKLLNPTRWSVDCYRGLMGLFSGASNDLFCEKHYFLECKTYFRQSPRVLVVRELFNSHCPFNLIHGTFLTVCATESDISQNNEVFHVIMTIQEKNYNM